MALMNELESNGPQPAIVFESGENKAIDFHCINLTQYRSSKCYDNISSAVDTFFTMKNSKEFNSQRANDLQKIVGKQLEKCEKRLAINLQTYEENNNYEDLKLFGELITANIYSLSKGMDKAEVVNYYTENGDTVIIPLSSNKTPQQNAQAYFKKYNKARTAYQYAEKEIEVLKTEIAYLESVVFAIEASGNSEQLAEIRLELHEQGYLKSAAGKGGKSGKNRKIQPVQALPLKLNSKDGYEILIGRNNKENDKLTLKTARHEDVWFHIKNFPGSHVVIRTEGRDVPDSTLVEAAQYAAWFSKARSAPKVEVDYTFVRNVKKPSGAKPGMVIYVNYSTISVAPKEPGQ
jgi:predicted ribosome quality control (RQC) complex YloA/Tae2 family protein